MAVKNFTGTAQAVMSSYNFIGNVASCNNSDLLNTVLRDEWGFVGMVITDYNGSYGYQTTDNCIKNGNDLMLGYGTAESNQLNTESATTVLAMRQASKNILYTIANSGYYVDSSAVEISTDGLNKMQITFYTVDAIVVVIVLLAEALVLILFFLKRKKAAAKITVEKE